MKDAIDLLQGHYIVSVSREVTPTSQKGGLEAVAVSTIQTTVCFIIKFDQVALSSYKLNNED